MVQETQAGGIDQVAWGQVLLPALSALDLKEGLSTPVLGGDQQSFPGHDQAIPGALVEGGHLARRIDPAQALDCVYGYAVGLDLTRRDLQLRAKDKGHPWDMGKGFDQSAPIAAIHPLATVGHPARGSIWLKVNGQLRQNGDLEQMSWKVAEVIAKLSTYVTLAAGDLIFTGTPAGVSTVLRGDVLEAGVAGVGEICVRLV